MDQPFTPSRWRPSAVPAPPDPPSPPADAIASLSVRLAAETRALRAHPYAPALWLARAGTLARLGYPELALGDAFKARELCGAVRAQARGGKNPANGWRLGAHMGFWMRAEEGEETGGLREEEEEEEEEEPTWEALLAQAREVEVGCLRELPDRDAGRGVGGGGGGGGQGGAFRRVLYPWMRPRHCRRSSAVIRRVNDEFAGNAVEWLGRRAAVCEVRRSAFGGDKGEDVLGVFAKAPLAPHSLVLIDETEYWGCNGHGHDKYGCSAKTRRRATARGNHGHGRRRSRGSAEATQTRLDAVDLDWVSNRVVSDEDLPDVLLRCRLLLSCVRDKADDPLDHPLVARLTATYHRIDSERLYYSLDNDYRIMNEALRRFSIDIFANHDYDTWVLFTIAARVRNNSCCDPISEHLNPLFSLFNHSCEPNVKWTSTAGNHSTVELRATRDIAAGEQLFVEYDAFMSGCGLDERRKRLWRWLDAACRCTRCVREEDAREARRRRRAAEEQRDGWVKVSLDGDDYVGDEGVVEEEVPEWDRFEKPVFLEDSSKRRDDGWRSTW